MRLEGSILICNIWCHDQKQADMGIETSLWLDFGIDLSSVFAMKVNGEGDTEFEQEAKDKSTLYTQQGIFTVDVDFEELFPKWIKIKNK